MCERCISWELELGVGSQVRTEDVALVEAIGGDDCVLLALLVHVLSHCAPQ